MISSLHVIIFFSCRIDFRHGGSVDEWQVWQVLREARETERLRERERTYNDMYIREYTTTNNSSQSVQCVCGPYLRLASRPSRRNIQCILGKLIGENSSVLFSLPRIQQVLGIASSHLTLPHGYYGWFWSAQAVHFIPRHIYRTMGFIFADVCNTRVGVALQLNCLIHHSKYNTAAKPFTHPIIFCCD